MFDFKRDAKAAWENHEEQDIIVAVLYAGTEVYDFAYTWETAETMIGEGYTAVAVADDGTYWTAERAQSLYDGRREAYVDCFGDVMMSDD